MRSNEEMIAILVFVASILVFVYYMVTRLTGKNRVKDYIEVEATVINVYEKQAAGSRAGKRKVYCPVFSYEWKGFTRTLESEVWSGSTNFKVGDKVKLLVDPDDSSKFRYKDMTVDPLNRIIFIFLFMLGAIICAALKK